MAGTAARRVAVLQSHAPLRGDRAAAGAAAAAAGEAVPLLAPFLYAKPGGGDERVAHIMPVADGRAADPPHSADVSGFELRPFPLSRATGVDVYDVAAAGRALYPLAEEVLRAAFPGCARVLVFDHIVRDAARHAEATGGGTRPCDVPMLDVPTNVVHSDYTVRSGYTRARQLLSPHDSPARIDDALRGRFAFVNVWAPLSDVEQAPLGMLEWASTHPRDVVTLQLKYSHRVGELYRVHHSPRHRWVHYPEMRAGECVVFKVFDSATDGRARHVLHSGFVDPSSRAGARPRRSVELRCAVLFGDAAGGDFAASFVAPHLAPGSPDRIDQSPQVTALPRSDEW